MDFVLLLDLSLVLVGLGALWWFGDLVVHYIIEMANVYKVSTFFLGFIVLAIAADIPELAIAITSALQGASEVSVGDIIGANFSDVAMVVGTTLLVAGNKITIKRSDATKLLQMIFIATIIMLLVFAQGSIDRFTGLVLMGVYFVTITWMWRKRDRNDILHEEVAALQQDVKEHKDSFLTSRWGLMVKLGISLVMVMIASCLTVHYAVAFATELKIPLETIGATILGIGTSLPELILSLSALRRKEYALALGPTLGTVLQQTTFILGLLAFCSDKPVRLSGLHWAAYFMFAAFAVVSFGLLRKKNMGRGVGAVLLVLFVAYMMYQVVPGLA